MPAGVIDFSRWNNLEWWERAGYRTRDEAWADYGRTQGLFCTLTAAELQHQNEKIREINRKARAAC